MKKLFVLAAAFTFFVACNSPQPEEAPVTEETTTEEVAPETTTTETTAPEGAEAVITIGAGDNMKFDLSEIKVREGQKVKLTLNHTGKAPKTAMGHNFVLLAAGVDYNTFAKEAMAAKDSDYIPASASTEVIAHTKLLGGGESDTIEFDAPAKGTYEFMCSFPGHSGIMHGKFIVE